MSTKSVKRIKTRNDVSTNTEQACYWSQYVQMYSQILIYAIKEISFFMT